MAHAAARSRLFRELSRNRTNSSRDDEFATAGSFDVENDAVLHSTAKMEDHAAFFNAPTQNYAGSSAGNTEGSTDMSIEIGRGVTTGQHDDGHDISFDAATFLDNGSLQLNAIPSVRPRIPSRKIDGIVRRETSNRRASEQIKANDAMKRAAKPRTLSEALGRIPAPDDTVLPLEQPTTTLMPRNTRFSRARPSQASAQSNMQRVPLDQSKGLTPQKQSFNQQMMDPVTQTGNSFMLPDLPNISELVSGTLKDGTPIFNRQTKSRSRVDATAMNKSLHPGYRAIKQVPIPEQEKVIYTSLQLLKEKVAQLEMDKAEADKRAEEHDNEIISLRSQLEVAQQRPDSGLGTDDEGAAQAKLRQENLRGQAIIKTLQERQDKNHRQSGINRIAMERVSKERDALIKQIGVAYFHNEELKIENETLLEKQAILKEHNFRLQKELKTFKQLHREHQTEVGKQGETQSQARSSSTVPPKTGRTTSDAQTSKLNSSHAAFDPLLEAAQEDLPSRISREVQMHRDRAAASQQQANNPIQVRKRSRSRRRQSTELQDPTKNVQDFTIDDGRDFTELTDVYTNQIAELRKRIEEEHANRHRTQRTSSAPAEVQSNASIFSFDRDVTRKSLTKDATAAAEDTGRFSMFSEKPAKSVRVQSPHSSDAAAPPRSLSSANRFRGRALSSEGLTSAFIVPDITIRGGNVPVNSAAQSSQMHDAGTCTVCHPDDGSVIIPAPVPVSERKDLTQDPDVTNGTIRPSQPPALALATVIKQLNDEIEHLKMSLAAQQKLYNQHDPALSKRARTNVKNKMEALIIEIERRSDQCYALHDVVEGHRQAEAQAQKEGAPMNQMDADEVEETLRSVGLDPAELSGRTGRGAPPDLDEFYGDMDGTDSEGLPWEGLSDYESE